jgi:Secretion system C-terminal sorting domain
MKKIIIIFLFTFSINAKAQITLEHTYDSAGYYGGLNSTQQLYIVKLEVDGEKFVFIDKTNKLLRFYNLNHAAWKAISFAAATDLNPSANVMSILYISQYLFDTDGDIEFLYVDQNGSPQATVTQVVNEDGSIAFTANNQAPIFNGSVPQAQVPIYNTSSGTKMILSGGISTDGKAYVYSLGGTLATITGIKSYKNNEQNNIRTSMAYPNPTGSSTTIDYTLPKGVNAGVIVFYDTQGQEVKRFNIDNVFNSLVISTEDIHSGIYYYNLQTTQGFSDSKKLVTIK